MPRTLLFATEARFTKHKSGIIFSPDPAFSKELWDRYLEHFDALVILARVLHDPHVAGGPRQALNNPRISFIEVPYFLGPIQFLLLHKQLKKLIRNVVQNNYVFLARVPGTIGTLLTRELRRADKSYGLEVVGDPWDVFAPGVIKHPLRIVFRYWGCFSLSRAVKRARAVLYVTKSKLQTRYPVKADAFTTHASNVKIDSGVLCKTSKTWLAKPTYNIISIGSLEQLYKGPDDLIAAVEYLNRNGCICNLHWAGSGRYKENMIALSKKLKIESRVHFIGNLSHSRLMEVLFGSDLFVLASKTEGLPRAVIEAMAKGLPCVATNVGGIPELLSDEVLVPPGKPKQLAEMIKSVLTNEVLYNAQAARNLQVAKEYREEVLMERRKAFYQELKKHC